ncbi:Kinesin-like protein KIF16B [Dissostichus eleginoides]|uniref:Kinesin-like protein KIF16B n=1 Tax=Dissostichus eleginoides TaxID=100907 RepID=A0AAD9BLX5_DISEL|nr:Kinesin-like protein KIF16B [Dissostichus eleginoides]
MEEKHQSEKAELERLQQEVESQRKESEEVQQRILHQEESLRSRSQDIESRLQDFLAEKERFEEERRLENHTEDLQRQKVHREEDIEEEQEDEEQEDEEQRRQQQEAAEQTEIYRELERLKREREEQKVRLETERRRLEEQDREQLSLVGRLEEQLREKHDASSILLTREDARRLEEERRALADIRESLLRAKEASERTDVEDAGGKEARSALTRYTDFKEAQVKELGQLEEGLRQQRERLEKEVSVERNTLQHLNHGLKDQHQQLKETQEKEDQLVKQAEHRLQFKERQLASVSDGLLPALAEEKLRAAEMLERSGGGNNGNCNIPPGLDNTLFQQLQQLQETYEFTANVEARGPEAQRLSEPEAEEQRHNSSVRNLRSGAELEQHRVEQEIQKLRQRISEGEEQQESLHQ